MRNIQTLFIYFEIVSFFVSDPTDLLFFTDLGEGIKTMDDKYSFPDILWKDTEINKSNARQSLVSRLNSRFSSADICKSNFAMQKP